MADKERSLDTSDLGKWESESLRLTAFPIASIPDDQINWWNELVGEPPKTRTSRPREGGYQEEGPHENGKLTLRLDPTRIDWFFTGVDDENIALKTFPKIGLFSDSANIFLRLMLQWFKLGTCPPLQRLAFGAILLQPVEDLESGYRRLSCYIKSVELDPKGSSDFSYQINRPRGGKSVSGTKINRLSRWSVAKWQAIRIPMEPESMVTSRGTADYACRLELDINTTADFQGELPKEKLSQLFEELVRLGKEIAKEGDIP